MVSQCVIVAILEMNSSMFRSPSPANALALELVMGAWASALGPFTDEEVTGQLRGILASRTSTFPITPAEIASPLIENRLGLPGWSEEFERVARLLAREDGSLGRSEDSPGKTVGLRMRSLILNRTADNIGMVHAQFRDAYARECAEFIEAARAPGGALAIEGGAPVLAVEAKS